MPRNSMSFLLLVVCSFALASKIDDRDICAVACQPKRYSFTDTILTTGTGDDRNLPLKSFHSPPKS